MLQAKNKVPRERIDVWPAPQLSVSLSPGAWKFTFLFSSLAVGPYLP